VTVVVGLARGVDAHDRVELAVVGPHSNGLGDAVLEGGHAGDVEGLLAGQAQRRDVLPRFSKK
jgi:hypothetical protein